MNHFDNLKLGTRLGGAFAAVIVLAAVVVVFGITRLSQITESLVLVGSDRVPKVQKLADVTDDVNLIARELRNTLIWSDEAKVKTALETVSNARERVAKNLALLAPAITSDEGKKRMAAVNESGAVYIPVQLRLIALVDAGDRAAAVALLDEKLRPAQLAYM